MRGRLEWLRRDVLVEAGGNMALNPGVLLAVGGQRVIWTTRSSDGSLRFNLKIIDHTGETLLHLEDNEWVVTGPVLDIRAAASANDIRVASPSRGVTVSVTFSGISESDCREACEVEAAARADKPVIPPELIAVLPPSLVAASTPTKAQVFNELWAPFGAANISWPALRVGVAGKIKYPLPIRFTRSKMTLSDRLTMGGNRLFLPGATLISAYMDTETPAALDATAGTRPERRCSPGAPRTASGRAPCAIPAGYGDRVPAR